MDAQGAPASNRNRRLAKSLVRRSIRWTRAWASLPPAPTSAPPPSPSPDVLWYFFLRSVNNHDRAAIKFQNKGLDGTWIRDLHQVKLGFTPEQFAPIRASAQLMEAEIKQVDASARSSGNASYMANPSEALQPSESPSATPGLVSLNPRHEAVLLSVISGLKSALGPQLTARLDMYVKTRIAANVKVHKMQREVAQ